MSFSDKEELLARIEKAMDSVRPHLIADGGNVEVVELQDDGVLVVRYTGACLTCGMKDWTLKGGISRAVISKVPEVSQVIALSQDTV